MKRKIFNVLFALVLVLSFSLVTAAPAAAVATTLHVVPFTLEAGTGCTAEWTTGEFHTGSASVKLVNPAGAVDANYAEVAFALASGTKLSDITMSTTSFYCKTASAWTPYFIFRFGDGTGINGDTAAGAGYTSWAKYIASSTPQWQWPDGSWNSWTDTLAAYKDSVVTKVLVELSGLPAGAYTAYVDDIAVSGTTFNLEGTATDYTTIMAAIAVAHPGDTIIVAEGICNENLVVGVEDLTLKSSGATASTIINAANASDYVVEITADNVTLDGFTITGLAATNDTLANNAAVITQGVDYCTIKNNILTGNHEVAISLFGGVGGAYSDYNTVFNNVINGPNGQGETYGIKIKGSHNTISGNKIYNADTSIHVWSWWDNPDTEPSETVSPDYNIISGNTIAQGTGGTANHKYGIEIKTGQHSEVTGNTISVKQAAIHLYTSDVMVSETDFDPRPASNNISGNTITGGEVGICLLEGSNNNTISGNTITGTTTAGILGSLSRWPTDWSGKTLAFTDDTDHLNYLQIVGNTISRNTITNCGHGIAMQYGDDNTLAGNTIHGNTSVANIDYHGVVFEANAAGVYFDENSEGNVAHFNNIAGNTGYGLKSGADLNATNNWWGNASGPVLDTLPCEGYKTDYKSYGDKVTNTNVDFEPWLLAAVTPGVTPTTYTKTLALKKGWTLVSVDKEVTIGTEWEGTAELSPSNTILAYKYIPGTGPGTGYPQVTLATELTSVDAYYVKTDGGGGVGIKYSTIGSPGVVTKDLSAGWNIISCAGETDAYTLLSQLRDVQIGQQVGVGITNLIGQGNYNQFTDSFSYPLVTNRDWNDNLSAVKLSPFDGYWVYLNAAKIFGVIPD